MHKPHTTHRVMNESLRQDFQMLVFNEGMCMVIRFFIVALHYNALKKLNWLTTIKSPAENQKTFLE